VIIVVEQSGNGLFDARELRGEPSQVRFHAGTHVLAQALAAILLLGLHFHQALVAQHQRPQSAFGFRRWRPHWRLLLPTEVRQQLGIQGIGFAAQPERLPVGLGQGRIDHRHPLTGIGQIQRSRFPVGPCRLHANVHLIGAMVMQPLAQPGEPFRRVGEGLAAVLGTQPQGTIQLGLGNVYPQRHRRSVHACALHLVKAGCRVARAEDTVRVFAS